MKARMALWKIRRGLAKGLQRLGSRLDLRLRIVPGVMAGDLAPQFFVNGVMVSETEAVDLGLWFAADGGAKAFTASGTWVKPAAFPADQMQIVEAWGKGGHRAGSYDRGNPDG